ncbi:hypothetical protein DFH08DRAFT_860653, partial [Mycena albidolilacea]
MRPRLPLPLPLLLPALLGLVLPSPLSFPSSQYMRPRPTLRLARPTTSEAGVRTPRTTARCGRGRTSLAWDCSRGAICGVMGWWDVPRDQDVRRDEVVRERTDARGTSVAEQSAGSWAGGTYLETRTY